MESIASITLAGCSLGIGARVGPAFYAEVAVGDVDCVGAVAIAGVDGWG